MDERDEARDRHVEQKLTALAGKEYLPKELVNLVAQVARLHLEARRACAVEIPADLKLPDPDLHLQGRALIEPADFPYDAAQARDLFGKALDILERSGGPVAAAGTLVRQDLDAGRLDLGAVFAAYLRQDQEYFAPFAERSPEAPLTLPFLAQAALTPSLEAAAEKLLAERHGERAWEHGHCPVCGRPPLIAELAGKEGVRMLTCSFCHARYRAPRMMCAFCGERDHAKLPFFTVEEEPGYRVDVCSTCKRYIKTIDFRSLDRVPVPLLDDLDSLALDMVASREGYGRPTLSGWGF
ncbi:MAG: formate dehydrogenase accessory protein FdhE [Thermodesulfobacteriota bacterium]